MYNESFEVDCYGRCLRRLAGMVRFPRRFLTKEAVDLKIQYLRVVPQVKDGFVRTESSYHIGPNGRRLTYEIIEKQIFREP